MTHRDPSGRCLEALALAFLGPEGALAGGGITIGCAVATAVVATVGAALTGVAIGQATSPLIEELRGDPTDKPWTPPQPDIETWRGHVEIVESKTPEIHTGLPGGFRLPPGFCGKHPTACKVIAITGIGIVGWIITQKSHVLEGTKPEFPE